MSENQRPGKPDIEVQKVAPEDLEKAKKSGKVHGDPILVIE